jgi:hypothetical protein
MHGEHLPGYTLIAETMSTAERGLSGRLLVEQTKAPKRMSMSGVRESNDKAWRAVGWFGLLLAFVGCADIAMVWFPTAFGNPTWQFGAVDMSFTSLPLLTMGLAAMLASAFARRTVRRMRLVGAFLLIVGLTLLGAYTVFYVLNIPLALKATPTEMKVGIWKSIIKTTLLGVTFPAAYIAAGFAALRNASSDLERG